MDNVFEERDGRYHCTVCGWSTQLPNKAGNHQRKKHGGIPDGGAPETELVTRPVEHWAFDEEGALEEGALEEE